MVRAKTIQGHFL